VGGEDTGDAEVAGIGERVKEYECDGAWFFRVDNTRVSTDILALCSGT